MTTATTTRKHITTAPKLAFRRIGPSDYSHTLNAGTSKQAELRVTGTYIKGTRPDSDVSNAWVWTARLNGNVVDSPETITRKRDAIALLKEEITRQDLWEASESSKTATKKKAAAKMPSRKAALATGKAVVAAHPIFRPAASTPVKAGDDSIMNTTVRIKGTTLVGEVIAKTTGEKERLRVQSPEGYCIWALRDVVELVAL